MGIVNNIVEFFNSLNCVNCRDCKHFNPYVSTKDEYLSWCKPIKKKIKTWAGWDYEKLDPQIQNENGDCKYFKASFRIF